MSLTLPAKTRPARRRPQPPAEAGAAGLAAANALASPAPPRLRTGDWTDDVLAYRDSRVGAAPASGTTAPEGEARPEWRWVGSRGVVVAPAPSVAEAEMPALRVESEPDPDPDPDHDVEVKVEVEVEVEVEGRTAPEPAPDRHLRVVEPRRRFALITGSRTRVIVWVGVLGAVIVVFALVYLHVMSAQKQFEINRLDSEEQTLAQRYQDLRVQASQANSPARIIGAAERLGMTEPASVQVLPVAAGSLDRGEPSAPSAPASGRQAPAGVSDWSQMQPVVEGNP